MSREQYAAHLEHPRGLGITPDGAFTGAAGGAACGDLVRVSVALEPGRPDGLIAAAGFDASGCGACLAAGSALVGLLQGRTLLQAARIGAAEISGELGGLHPAKRHAAELTADALHRALGQAARACRLDPSAGRRTLVAMSGGVDSAVSALLVGRSGAEGIAVTLELWSDPENDGQRSCCSAEAVRGARALAHSLGMPHLSIDLREEFRAGVVEPWLEGYAAGLTPNPCVRCNGSVRLDAMLELAGRLGAGSLVTGHYARIEEPAGGGEPLLRAAADSAKDQSYVLAALPPAALRRLRFPLGELRKSDVRALAAEAGLPVASKPDSQDLCFLAGTDRSAFLARHGGLEARPGPIRDRSGRLLGEHRGAHAYTVGQRRGLGLGTGEPLYVLATEIGSNGLTVGPREALLTSSVPLRAAMLHRPAREVDAVKLRYRGRPVPCRMSEIERGAGSHESLRIDFEGPVERTAPGQLACLYAGELVVGHGTVSA